MDDLPELPFEKVLSYLNLEDRLKARAVSRRWYHKINSFKVNTLCYSERPIGHIVGKNRWVSGAFAKNFISSTLFASFFDTYGQTTLSNLKHLRLCNLNLTEGDTTAFDRTLNSFGQLETLDIIRAKFEHQRPFNLNLPMLTRLHLENVFRIRKLTLEAPRLREIKIRNRFESYLEVEIVHGESVERLLVDHLRYTEVKKLKNIQYLYFADLQWVDLTFLSSLQQLKEIHTNHPGNVPKLFERKQRYGRVDLKIYLKGLLLNGPDDPTIHALRGYLSREGLVCLAENLSRLADEIPFYRHLCYSAIEGVVPDLEVDLLKRFTDLNEIRVDSRVQNTQRFLNLLKNCEDIVEFVEFSDNDQPQDLFDRLPEHSAVQSLTLYCPPSDLAFLFRLKNLIDLDVGWSIDSETVRRAFDELPVLSSFVFRSGHKLASVRIVHPKQLHVWINRYKEATVFDLSAAIDFLVENESE